jgi:hypothetical protein
VRDLTLALEAIFRGGRARIPMRVGGVGGVHRDGKRGRQSAEGWEGGLLGKLVLRRRGEADGLLRRTRSTVITRQPRTLAGLDRREGMLARESADERAHGGPRSGIEVEDAERGVAVLLERDETRESRAQVHGEVHEARQAVLSLARAVRRSHTVCRGRGDLPRHRCRGRCTRARPP